MRSTELALTVTLDWLAHRFPAPDVLKIDVEGAELAVLAGGPSVLAADLGYLRGQSGRVAVGELLRAHGYAVYDGDLLAADRVPVAIAPFNTLAMAAAGVRSRTGPGQAASSLSQEVPRVKLPPMRGR